MYVYLIICESKGLEARIINVIYDENRSVWSLPHVHSAYQTNRAIVYETRLANSCAFLNIYARFIGDISFLLDTTYSVLIDTGYLGFLIK